MAPGRDPCSRNMFSPVATAASALVVGTLRACMASDTRYSRKTGPYHARPSPDLDQRVRPDPLSCRSTCPASPKISPKRIARPSPNCGFQ